MANMDRPAYQGKALSPGDQMSQGRATGEQNDRMNRLADEKGVPATDARRLNPSGSPKNPHSE